MSRENVYNFDIEKEIKGNQKEKKLHLYYLYLYHMNYKNEDIQTKRDIREYYDTQLRYKGAFYKDKRVFEERGNPLNWEDTKVSRYKTQEEQHRYFTGMDNFQQFAYPSSFLIELEVSKKVNIPLVERHPDELDRVNFEFSYPVTKEIRDLLKIINRMDKGRGNYLVKSSYDNQTRIIDIQNKQVVFKIQVNEMIVYISTKYIPDGDIIENSINVLESYMRKITGMEKDLPQFITASQQIIQDEIQKLRECILLRIYVKKTTTTYKTSMQTRFFERQYEIEANTLTSLKIVQGM